MIPKLGHDLRIAMRSLLRTPLVALATVLTLAIACAGTLATWSLVEAVFLRALPYAQAGRLVAVWVDMSGTEGEIGIEDARREWTNFDHYLDLRDHVRSFDGIVAWRGWNPTLSGEGEAERLSGVAPTWNLFEVLGVQPALGRGFLPEDAALGAPYVAVIGHGLWQRRFGGDASVIGRRVEFNRMPYTIVGVMPPGFRFPGVPQAELFGAYQERTGDRGHAALRQFARLAPNVDLRQAQQELDALAANLREQYPDTHRSQGLFVEPLQASLGREVRTQLLVLQGAALMVLLIAAANLASLSVARAVGRRGEFGLRAILGASGWQQWRLLLCESLLLALVGGLLGWLLAQAGVRLLTALFPEGFARAWDVHIGLGALLLALALSMLVALVIAASAAAALRRSGLAEANVQIGARSIGERGGARLTTWLVAGNFALALTVAVASMLLLESHQRLQQVALGYRPDGLVSGVLLLPSMAYPDDADLLGAQQRLRERMMAIPGVEAVGFSTGFPLTESASDAPVQIEGHPTTRPGGSAHVWINRISHDFLDTLGVRLREGRPFEMADARPEVLSVLVNAAFARQYIPEGTPLGKRLGLGVDGGTQWYEVIGVVDDVRYFGVDRAQTPSVYFSLQAEPHRSLYLTLRGHGDPATLMAGLRTAVHQVDPALALSDLCALDERVDAALAMPRALSHITLLFALSGLLLAGIGVYGALAHMVLRRTRDLGVRRALGANTRDVWALVLAHALRPALLGTALGLPLAWLLARELRGILFDIGPMQLSAWAVAVLALALIALAAAALPARRAARIEPMRALREG